VNLQYVIIISVKYHLKHGRIDHFFHCGTSFGAMINDTYLDRLYSENIPRPMLFTQLEEAKISWKVYFDAQDILPLTLVMNFRALRNLTTHFVGMDQFYHDVKNGTLPSYSFIQPRFLLFPNDMHPRDSDAPVKGHSSVLAGEKLIHDVYTAIRSSNSNTGSNRSNTLLIITFDEGGGCYDHVPPPSTIPPTKGQTGDFGFKFNRLGQRVPCILVSPYIKPGTVCSEILHHTSIVKLVRDNFGIKGTLTRRDETAPAFPKDLFGDSERKEWPTTQARPVPDVSQDEGSRLSDLGADIFVGINKLMAFIDKDDPEVLKLEVKASITAQEAVIQLKKYKAKLGILGHVKEADTAIEKCLSRDCTCIIL